MVDNRRVPAHQTEHFYLSLLQFLDEQWGRWNSHNQQKNVEDTHASF